MGFSTNLTLKRWPRQCSSKFVLYSKIKISDFLTNYIFDELQLSHFMALKSRFFETNNVKVRKRDCRKNYFRYQINRLVDFSYHQFFGQLATTGKKYWKKIVFSSRWNFFNWNVEPKRIFKGIGIQSLDMPIWLHKKCFCLINWTNKISFRCKSGIRNSLRLIWICYFDAQLYF